LQEAVKGVDQVFHLAGVTRALKEETYFEVNANGTENLIHACLEKNPHLQKFIYLSSQAAAGPCQDGGRKKESDHCEPVSPYGRSKRRGEEFCLEHVREIPLVILRPSAVYGPRDRDVYAFFKILTKRIKPSFSRQEQHISLCYVQDIVQATLLASDSGGCEGEIFFLSDGHDYRLDKIGDLFEEAMDIHAYRIHIPGWVISGVASFSELFSKFSGKPPLINKGKVEEMVQKNWLCDITKAKTLLSFEPRFSLAEGIKITYEWYRKENWL
jgi:nucleoside-diphosphate-sugar epimerase